MKHLLTAEGFVFALVVALSIVSALYMGARHDLEQCQKSGNAAFNMLPKHKQQELMDAARYDHPDPSEEPGPWENY